MIKELIALILHKVKASWNDNNQMATECMMINMRRIFFNALVLIPVHLVTIFIFIFTYCHNTSELYWRIGILSVHSVLLVLVSVYLLLSFKFKNYRKSNRLVEVLQYIVVVTILAAGVIISSIDQLVTTNITPYMMACLICGTLYLIRPICAFLLFVFSYVSFYLAIGINSTQEALLTNRVNGITIAALGFALSLIMWRNNRLQILQRKQIQKQQEDLKRLNIELEHMAFSDSLTGLTNRRYFNEAVKNELVSMGKYGHKSSIIEFDLDHFKMINDTYGHFAGDIVLQKVAELVAGVGRKTDIFCRYGGEEFIILLPKTSLDQAYHVAENIRNLLENYKYKFGDTVIQVTASFGVTQLEAGISKSNNYINADKALYKAKQKGRNRVEIFA